MTDRPPSAAAALYPHLQSAARPLQQQTNKPIAYTMYPKLGPKPPPLPEDPYLRHMQAYGLIRKDAGRRR
jgi:hypothetical protein